MPGFAHRARFPPERMLIYYPYAYTTHVDFLSTAVIATVFCVFILYLVGQQEVWFWFY